MMVINETHGIFGMGGRAAPRNILIIAALLFVVGVTASAISMGVGAASADSNLSCLDKNDNNVVDIPELFDVIDAYFEGTVGDDLGCVDGNGNGIVDIGELFDVIDVYFDRTPIEPAASSFGPGTLRVGEDIAPGVYAGRAGTGILDSCYWARLKGASGELDDIIANDNANGQFYVEVLETDAYFKVNCEVTSLADWPVPSPRLTSLDPGMYIVGRDIDAGTYRGEAGEGILESCYWARLSGVTGTLDDILANDNANGQFYVEVLETDAYFKVNCEVTSLADWPVPSPRLTSLDPGMYIVGRDIDAGTYRGEAGEGILESCYWARLSGVTGTLDDILANDNANGQFFVEVETTDYALNTRCRLHLTDEEQEEEVDALAMYDDNGDGRITCAEARRHGIAPVYRGEPAYPYMDDADGDGVVCE